MNITVEVDGKEHAAALRDKLDEAIYSVIDIHCGEPECCPGEPYAGQPSFAMSSSTITDELPDEED